MLLKHNPNEPLELKRLQQTWQCFIYNRLVLKCHPGLSQGDINQQEVQIPLQWPRECLQEVEPHRISHQILLEGN